VFHVNRAHRLVTGLRHVLPRLRLFIKTSTGHRRTISRTTGTDLAMHSGGDLAGVAIIESSKVYRPISGRENARPRLIRISIPVQRCPCNRSSRPA
jgi:hypothetical protein